MSLHDKALIENFRIMAQDGKLTSGLTGPHHVGAEIDLEFQAAYNAAWRTFSKIFLLGSLAAVVAAGYQKQTGGDLGLPLLFAGFGAAGAFFSQVMSKTLASRALTETHPALRHIVGPTGGWSSVSAQDLGPITLPDGRVIEPADIRPDPQSSTVSFERYPRRD